MNTSYYKKLWVVLGEKTGNSIWHPQYYLRKYVGEAVAVAVSHASGVVVDVGCGRQPYRQEFIGKVDKYIGVDHPQVHEKYEGGLKPEILADATAIPLADNYANVVLMFSVLEHLPRPEKALAEAQRLTKRGGRLILLTVQNYILHDEPYDYFRYTRWGLEQLAQDTGWKVVSVTPMGNFLELMGQYLNVNLLYGIKDLLAQRGVKKIFGVTLLPGVVFISWISNVLVWVFSRLGCGGKPGRFAMLNLLVAIKR